MSHLQRYMTTHPGANIAECMGLMVGTIQKMALENAHAHSQLHEVKKELCQSHDQLRQLRVSHNQLQNAHDQLYKSHDRLCELCVLHEKLQQSHNQLSRSHDTLSKTHIEACEMYEALCQSHDQLRLSHDTQNEKYLRQMEESHQLANKMEKSQEKMDQLESTMTAHTCEKQGQKIVELQKMIDKNESESMENMRAIESSLQASLAAQQTTILAKYSDENTQLRQAISEQERKQQENEATVMALKDDFSHKIAISEQNICEQEATLTLHQQTLERMKSTKVQTLGGI